MSNSHCFGNKDHRGAIDGCQITYDHKHCRRNLDHIKRNKHHSACLVPGCSHHKEKHNQEKIEGAKRWGAFVGEAFGLILGWKK